MNCARWEEQLALRVEGDLPARQSAKLEGHLASCAGCRDFRVALEKSQLALKALAADSLEEATLAAVRARVMTQVRGEQEPKLFTWWRLGIPLAFAAVMVAAILWPRGVPPPRAPLAAIIPAAPDAPRIVRATHASRHRRRPAVRETHTAAPVEPLLMRIQTDDPNVVIYWIVEGKETGD